MKTNIITFLVLLYVLLGSTYSFLPTFAQTTEPAAVEPPATEQQSISDIIISLLDQSNSQVEQQIQQLESQGIEIPPDVNTIFEEGVAEYQTTIESLENGDIENGKEHALEALSLFEDALEELFEAEGDIAEAQEDFAEDFFELQGSITELETEANEIRELVEINNLNINFDNFDTLIDEAIENLATGDLFESEQQIDLADDFLDDVLDQIEDEVEEEQDEHLDEFVEDTIEELEDIIKEANEAGISSSLVTQLENIVNDLQNAENPSDIFSITEANSDLEDILSQFQDLVPEEGDEIEEEAEEEAEDEVEDDFEDEVEEEAEDEVEDDFEDDPSSSGSSDSSGSDDDDDDSGSGSSGSDG